jgi:hypothetical protein
MSAAYRDLAEVSPAKLRKASGRLALDWEYTHAGLQRLQPPRNKHELLSDLTKVTASLDAKYGSSAPAADEVSAYMKKTCGLQLD